VLCEVAAVIVLYPSVCACTYSLHSGLITACFCHRRSGGTPSSERTCLRCKMSSPRHATSSLRLKTSTKRCEMKPPERA